MKKAKPKSGKVAVRSVVIPKDIDLKLLAIAGREERPLSWIILRACRDFIERDEKKGGKRDDS